MKSYPNCALTTVESLDEPPPGSMTWSSSLQLSPEIFPILRHAQFEDLLAFARDFARRHYGQRSPEGSGLAALRTEGNLSRFPSVTSLPSVEEGSA